MEIPDSQHTQLLSPRISQACKTRSCGGCSELAEAEVQVAVAQNTFESARERLARAKTIVNCWHDRLIARLPPEIISEIFILASIRREPRCGSRDSTRLAGVCQRWRDIALAIPQLWNELNIDIWKHSTRVDIMQDILLRSRYLPLYLTFYDSGLAFGEWSAPLDHIVEIIRSHSTRWQYLDFKMTHNHDRSPTTALLHKLFHNLESIPTSDRFEFRLGEMGCPHPIFLSEPLRPRVFHHSEFIDDERNIPLRWDNLTQLKVEHFSAGKILDIVRNAPRLLELSSIDTSSLDIQPLPFSDTPIIHRCLKKLTLIGDDCGHCEILPHITLPSLQFMNCHIGPSDEPELGDLIDFIQRSDLKPESLQTFHLQYDIYEEDFSHRFVELAALTHIIIYIDGNSSTPLHSHLLNFAEPSVLPHLRHLDLHFGDCDTGQILPASWALLADLCQEETSNIGPSATCSEENVSGNGVVRRPLESLMVINCARLDMTAIEEVVVLRFLEVQRAGLVKLHLRDKNRSDLLKTMAQIYECPDVNLNHVQEASRNRRVARIT